MKVLIIIILSLVMGMGTTRISSIDQGSTWIHLYNESGQKYKTLSVSSVGEIVGYSSTFFITRTNHWYHLWDADGKKYKTLSISSTGEIISVSGDTFTSRTTHWIYTWDRYGKKINTRAAR